MDCLFPHSPPFELFLRAEQFRLSVVKFHVISAFRIRRKGQAKSGTFYHHLSVAAYRCNQGSLALLKSHTLVIFRGEVTEYLITL